MKLTIGDYRLSKADERNLVIEKHTNGVNPKTKEPTSGWSVFGFYSTRNLPEAVRVIGNLAAAEALEKATCVLDFERDLAAIIETIKQETK
jgi:hypothetical protein